MRLSDYVSSGSIITQIELSYFSEPLTAGEWQTVPTWAIKLKNEGFVYLNAFTGELEGLRKYQ